LTLPIAAAGFATPESERDGAVADPNPHHSKGYAPRFPQHCTST
jgi:hypothetical protein